MQKTYEFLTLEDEFEFICKICMYNFTDGVYKPFYLPCSDMVCEKCMLNIINGLDNNIEKSSTTTSKVFTIVNPDSFVCPACNTLSCIEDLRKIKYNREVEKMIRKSIRNSCTPFNKNSEPRKNTHLSICNSHKKEYISDLYCFYHEKKICPDCLLEHQFNECNLKTWTIKDTDMLVNDFKSKLIKFADLHKNFNESLYEIESRLNDQYEYSQLDLFKDHKALVNNFNRIIEENCKHKPFRGLTDINFIQSSMEFNTFYNICRKLKEKTILSNEECMKFITNNFKITNRNALVNARRTVESFPNILVYAFNNYNSDVQFFVSYNKDYYIVENIYNEIKMKLIETEINFKELNHDNHKEHQVLLCINGTNYKYYNIFIYDDLFQIDDNSNNKIMNLYYNDKYFVFDFLFFIEINNNYLKFNFRSCVDDKFYRLTLKIIKYYGQNEFIVDNYILESADSQLHNFYYLKNPNNAKIKIEGSYFKNLTIENEIEINSEKIKINLNGPEISGKLESIIYFRLLNC